MNTQLLKSLRQRLGYAALLAAGLATWWGTLPSAASKASDDTLGVLPTRIVAGDTSTLTAVSTELNRPRLEPARRDPFAIVAAVVPTAPVQAAQAAVQPVVVTPSAPDLGLQFAGRMVTPTGAPVIYATHGSETLTLTVGEALPNGYQVENITAQSVEFRYPALGTTARLTLPPAPQYEVR